MAGALWAIGQHWYLLCPSFCYGLLCYLAAFWLLTRARRS